MEEKYGKRPVSAINVSRDGAMLEEGDQDAESSTDSEDEDEDDEGILASEALDAQIHATLTAIRAKDPRVYDEESTFYDDADEELQGGPGNPKRKDKPMYLSDYHRRNLLAGTAGREEDEEQSMTYAQAQDHLKSTLVKEMHAATNAVDHQNENARDAGEPNGESGGDDDDFLVRKPSKQMAGLPNAPVKRIQLNVEAADKDPETYLSNFMAARAWVPSAGSQFQPFESDDEEEDRRAEAFEEAYNLRFENPNGANEKLMSHARDAATKYSVRKEDANCRKKARDSERAKKEAEKREREEEKARLRKLRIAEAEEKVKKIKQAAGLSGKSIKEEDWAAFLDESWDDDRWAEEMKTRFGDEYYADQELEEGDLSRGKPKLKKPTWDDDIDIKDLVPGFESDDGNRTTQFTLSDIEEDAQAMSPEDQVSRDTKNTSLGKTHLRARDKASTKRKRDEQKKEARKDRRAIEKLVDEKLNAEDTLSGVGSKKTGRFRYRETSPLAFGLTPRDILMASDSQLNQYAGLKKMATFRDNSKKRKDKKYLRKKARLREWRKETFGDERGPQKSLGDLLVEQGATDTVPKHSARTNMESKEGTRQGRHAMGGKTGNSRP